MIEVLKSKIHRAIVTESDLNYEGSISISKEWLEEVDICEYEKVLVVDVENGNRFETYVIAIEEKGVICVNGAAARLVNVGDKVIIMAFTQLSCEEAKQHTPKVLHMEGNNLCIINK